MQKAEITASDGAASDNFGVSAVVFGNIAVIGAYGKTVGSNAAQGAAYVFDISNPASPVQKAEITASDGAASDHFGRSVAVSGNTTVIGAYSKAVGGHSSQGAAYIFDISNPASPVQKAEITSSDGAANDNFGVSVAVFGNIAIIGAYYKAFGPYPQMGAAYVFDFSNPSSPVQTAELRPSDSHVYDYFGSSVAVYGDGALIAADNKTVSGFGSAGAVYLFSVPLCSNPTGGEGDVIYNSHFEVPEYCNGINWIATGRRADPCRGSPAAGTVCLDGTVYAGLSPDGNVPMYTTPCDAGQYWNGSVCVACSSGLWSGSRTTCSTTWSSTNYPTWNNGTSNWTVTGYTSAVTGKSNTAGLAALSDAGSPYDAASYCDSLTAYRHSDWYLLAKDELNVMYGNKMAIGNFDATDGSTAIGGAYPGLYWASTEASNTNAGGQRFSDGAQVNVNKIAHFSVRCVRK